MRRRARRAAESFILRKLDHVVGEKRTLPAYRDFNFAVILVDKVLE